MAEEKDLLDRATETIKAIETSDGDSEELAYLMLLLTEAYGAGSCVCEEKGASFGEKSEEAVTCRRSVAATRDEILNTYKRLIDRLRKG